MNYTNDEFKTAINKSISWRQVLQKLGYTGNSGYRTVKRKASILKLSTEHFKGQGSTKGLKLGRKRPIQDYLTENNVWKIRSSLLKERLIEENIFERKCYSCDSTKWLDKLIPLELEHINGNKEDNRLINLTILCPNCHAFTETYRGKNKRLKRLQAGVVELADTQDLSPCA